MSMVDSKHSCNSYQLLEESACSGNEKTKHLLGYHEGHSWLMLILRSASIFVALKDDGRRMAMRLRYLGGSYGSSLLGHRVSGV
jgi:hypothetical protein